MNEVASAKGIVSHVKIVAEKSALRRLAASGQELAKAALGQEHPPRALAEAYVSRLSDYLTGEQSHGMVTIEQSVAATLERVEAAYRAGGQVTGVPTGIPDLDQSTSGWQPGDLIILAARPSVGKTALALNLATSAARDGVPVAIFSLEMSHPQLTQRMLSHASQLNLLALRSGRLSEQDWVALSRNVERVATLPIAIDDTSGATVSHMRTQCRRLRATTGLGMIIVDYLQLMAADERAASREQEVSQMSRGLKGLAREFGVPLISLSQLSRECERRTDRRPRLSDLRECVAAGQRVLLASGEWKVVEDVGAGDVVMGLDVQTQQTRPATVLAAGPSGLKQCYRLRTRSGRTLTVSSQHLLLTEDGRWTTAGALTVGSRVAVPYRYNVSGACSPTDGELCRLLGYMAGNGTCLVHREVGLCMGERATYDDAAGIVERNFPGVTSRVKRETPNFVDGSFACTYANGYGRPHGNPLREWLRDVDVYGYRDCDKAVPVWVLRRGAAGASQFLAGYMTSDGCVAMRQGGRDATVHSDTTSVKLAIDLPLLMASVGVLGITNGGSMGSKSTRLIFRTTIPSSYHNHERLASGVPMIGKRMEILRCWLQRTRSRVGCDWYFSLPRWLSTYLADVSSWRDQGKRLRRDICAAAATATGDPHLLAWSGSDVIWDVVCEKADVGDRETYDLTVDDVHNFIVEGVVTHNSGGIEQDADVVMFLYRPEMYGDKAVEIDGRKVSAAGMVELIIGKSRNGPTGSTWLVWDARTTSFHQLAEEWDS